MRSLRTDHTNLTLIDLAIFSVTEFPRMESLSLRHNKLKTLANSRLSPEWRSGLVEIDLSHNNLQVVQLVVLTGVLNLTRLDLSFNKIHTLIQVRTYYDYSICSF